MKVCTEVDNGSRKWNKTTSDTSLQRRPVGDLINLSLMIAHSLRSQCRRSFPLFFDELAGFLLRIRHEFAGSTRHIVLGDLIVMLRISVKLAKCHHIGSSVSAYIELGELLAATAYRMIVPTNKHGTSKHLA